MSVVPVAWNELEALRGAHAVTLGTFDGVHRGHVEVLAALERARSRPGVEGTVVVTFDPHPRAFLGRGPGPALLGGLEERTALLRATGPDHLVVLRFDRDLAAVPFDAFVDDVLRSRLGMVHFVLGHDVHFGRDRGGNAHSVRAIAPARGFSVDEIASVSVEGAPVSSTRIRRALEDGAFDRAIHLLGHPHLIRGPVVRGRGVGRELGFATANLGLGDDRIRPALGVYAGWARWDGGEWVPAIANVGRGPTVAPDDPPRVEVHLPGREVDLYDHDLELALAAFLRPERKFGGLEELRAAIRSDVESLSSCLAAVPFLGRPERVDRLDTDLDPTG